MAISARWPVAPDKVASRRTTRRDAPAHRSRAWQGRKTLPLRRDAGRDCAAFYPIAEFAELLDHASGACALGFSADRGTAFLIVGFPAQEEPNESAESMGDSPNGFFVFHSAG